MLDGKMASLRQALWKKRLPMLVAKDARTGNPYNYYSVHLVDVDHQRYRLVDWQDNTALIARWDYEAHDYTDERRITLAELDEMDTEIIHHRRYGPVSFGGILAFNFSYYTRFVYLKTLISRGKGRFVSAFFASKELKSRDRISLLNLLVNEYVHQRPSKLNAGVTVDEVIELLYGKLWYKHIRNEEFRRKVTLLLKSLVITEDLMQQDERYFVQPRSVATIVDYEKDERRSAQQVKMQKNIVRLMLIITASTLMITLALLSLAGVVDLHKIWHAIVNLKPIRVLFKLI
ncbi:hypothetical protein MUA04_09190 [Enterobacteriaceae bacterium H11S18]|uniref:hypothetical protein n=1 Tax=Dryocola clanedunensis TaxID=2925396 RepID=UPI0022F012A1|nr:hypothetical protein [Dryocola clanedunensis]MCT4704364.1 hypothetical protein [Dryocola clanedunensis]MCT4710363.1 hypothetical protein [Dryocola clanedunensis]